MPSKTDKSLSVELELQQLMSALEKHQKQEEGTKTDERQSELRRLVFLTSSLTRTLSRPVKPEPQPCQKAKASDEKPRERAKSGSGAAASSASASSMMEIWYSHWQ
jgi:hypothetical protein